MMLLNVSKKGPLLHDSDAASMSIIKWLMTNKIPLILDMYFPYCDVRDLAEAHINALVIFLILIYML